MVCDSGKGEDQCCRLFGALKVRSESMSEHWRVFQRTVLGSVSRMGVRQTGHGREVSKEAVGGRPGQTRQGLE